MTIPWPRSWRWVPGRQATGYDKLTVWSAKREDSGLGAWRGAVVEAVIASGA